MKKLILIIIPPLLAFISIYFYFELLDALFVSNNQKEGAIDEPTTQAIATGFLLLFIPFFLFLLVQNYLIINILILKKRKLFTILIITFFVSILLGILFGFLFWAKELGIHDFIWGTIIFSGCIFTTLIIDISVSKLLSFYIKFQDQ